QAGFYIARVSVQAPGAPVAVNVDTRESNVKSLPASEIVKNFAETEIKVAQSDMDLIGAIEQTRTGRSFWAIFILAGLVFFVIEGLLADLLQKRPSPANKPAPTSPHTEEV
ncbi:MAG: hypothetical protein HN350_16115, partial [Phycisphaerales bacterium]|nr:hypothetical protein [Phycisphaerales bacterium]